MTDIQDIAADAWGEIQLALEQARAKAVQVQAAGRRAEMNVAGVNMASAYNQAIARIMMEAGWALTSGRQS